VESSEATDTQTCETSLRERPRVSEKIETVKLFTCCSGCSLTVDQRPIEGPMGLHVTTNWANSLVRIL
jgi:hypothetical protein